MTKSRVTRFMPICARVLALRRHTSSWRIVQKAVQKKPALKLRDCGLNVQ